MTRLCFTSGDTATTLGWAAMLVLAMLVLAACARILAYSWKVPDLRFLYLSRSQRFFIGLFGVFVSLATVALCLYYFIGRPICGP